MPRAAPATSPPQVETSKTKRPKSSASDTSQVVHLTQAVADKATATQDQIGKVRQKLFLDSELTGFGLLVGKKRKAFIAQRYMGEEHRTVRVTVGRYGPMTVKQAREQARDVLVQMGKGKNPIADKRKRTTGAVTLRGAWGSYKDHLVRVAKRSPITVKHYAEYLERYLGDWLDKPLASITRAMVRDRHLQLAKDVAAGKYARRKNAVVTKVVPLQDGRTKVRKEIVKSGGDAYSHYARTGEATANHTFRALRAVFNHQTSVTPDLDNPAQVLRGKYYKTEPRKVVVPKNALGDWYKGLQAHVEAAQAARRGDLRAASVRRDFALFCMFSGMRKTSVQTIKLADVDFDKETLRVPNPKGGAKKAFTLPLSTALMEIAKQRRDDKSPESPYMFPGSTKTGYLSEVRVNVPGVTYEVDGEQRQHTLHDLRRTFITIAESLDISSTVIKSLVNHSQPKGDVTSGYVVHTVDRLRAPMQRITDHILAIIGDVDRPTRTRRAKGKAK